MKKLTVQQWLPYAEILSNGIIKLKNYEYIKIMTVTPINFNLKSELEKESILNSYKIFFKTCNFNIQILVQSNKEDLSKHIEDIKKIKSNRKIKKISENYIEYIQKLNKEKKSSNKNFYIIIKKNIENGNEKLAIEELNDNYFKIKECLSRCGNIVKDVNEFKEAEKIIYSFINKRIYMQNNI